jgi:hypothetical protein
VEEDARNKVLNFQAGLKGGVTDDGVNISEGVREIGAPLGAAARTDSAVGIS